MNKITLRVNGRDHELWADANRSLLDALHDDLGLPDVRYGCGDRLHQDPRRRRRVRGGAMTTLVEEFRIVGESPAHHDFVDKVKGSLLYAADWRLPGMLYGKVVRSLVPSARVTGVDTSFCG